MIRIKYPCGSRLLYSSERLEERVYIALEVENLEREKRKKAATDLVKRIDRILREVNGTVESGLLNSLVSLFLKNQGYRKASLRYKRMIKEYGRDN